LLGSPRKCIEHIRQEGSKGKSDNPHLGLREERRTKKESVPFRREGGGTWSLEKESGKRKATLAATLMRGFVDPKTGDKAEVGLECEIEKRLRAE